ncbi:hypothetical protein AADG42_01095 [Ammonicoccus fulvus]|uniref:CopG family transcriptional regulator n=1 Tax=Ammonicoccus fulvus TaxID=3138240 RepID=A0ABZ3FIY4_9ACTN
MANTRKVTITLSVEAVDSIKTLVESGQADSMSGFVQHAVTTALDDIGAWQSMLREALDETGGPLTDAERAWADSVLAPKRDSAA